MVMAAIDIVATYAQPPARAQRLVDIGFTIAFALQGAIWARELILGLIARRVGDGDDGIGARQCDIDHPRARQRRSVRAGDRRHPRQSRGQRHRAGRRARHRRHRHRPRRAGHLLGPVRGARDPVRQAVPARRHVRYGTTTGTVERIGLKTTRLRACRRRAGHHGQHQAARAGDAQRHRRPNPAHLAAVRPDLSNPAGNHRRPGRNPGRGGGIDQRLQGRALRRDRPRPELDRMRIGLRRPQRAIPTRWPGTSPRSSSASNGSSSARASPSPIRRRRPSPPLPTGRWSCPTPFRRRTSADAGRPARRDPQPHRRGGRRFELADDRPAADRRVRRRDRGPAVHPHRSRGRGADSVRRHHRATAS